MKKTLIFALVAMCASNAFAQEDAKKKVRQRQQE